MPDRHARQNPLRTITTASNGSVVSTQGKSLRGIVAIPLHYYQLALAIVAKAASERKSVAWMPQRHFFAFARAPRAHSLL